MSGFLHEDVPLKTFWCVNKHIYYMYLATVSPSITVLSAIHATEATTLDSSSSRIVEEMIKEARIEMKVKLLFCEVFFFRF